MSKNRNQSRVKRQNVTRSLREADGLGDDFSEVDLTPIHIDTKNQPEAERDPLFYIDGVEYTIPSKVPASLGLRYLRVLREEGAAEAAGEMLERVLGTETYDALMECEAVDDEQMQRIMRIVEHKVMGQLESTTGN